LSPEAQLAGKATMFEPGASVQDFPSKKSSVSNFKTSISRAPLGTEQIALLSKVTHLPKLTSMIKKVLRSINIGGNSAPDGSIKGRTISFRARFEAETSY
jgi:hypothetical protein